MRALTISQSITNRESTSLDRYFKEIGKIALISFQEEVILTKKIKTGDPAALERLTKANLRFVVSVAKQYLNKGLILGDLINEGNLGLIKAAKKFDESRGFKFITYAVWYIRQAILAALAEQSMIVDFPIKQIVYLNKIAKSSAWLEQQFERPPTDQELADYMGTTAEKIRDFIENTCKKISLDAPFPGKEDYSMHDVLQSSTGEADLNMIQESMRQEIKYWLNILSPRDSKVITLYFGLEGNIAHSIEEISEKLELTERVVRLAKERSLMRLKQNTKINTLRIYL